MKAMINIGQTARFQGQGEDSMISYIGQSLEGRGFIQKPTVISLDSIKEDIRIIHEELDKMRKTIKSISETLRTQKNVFIASLHDSRLKLCKPLAAFIEYDGYQYIAYVSDLDIYGCGESEYEALEDLRASIVDLYFDLKGDKLAPPLQKIWDYLNSIITQNES